MCQQLILKNEKKAVLNVLSCLFILSPKTLPSPLPPPHNLLPFSLRVNSQDVLETVKAFCSIKYLVRKFENEEKTKRSDGITSTHKFLGAYYRLRNHSVLLF